MTRKELIKLLEIPTDSQEALAMRREADALTRRRFNNKRFILGQIGVESKACAAKCQFCALAQGVFTAPPMKFTDAEVVERAKLFTAGGELGALFLMTMHDFDSPELLKLISAVRKAIPSPMKLLLNIGDCNLETWRTFKAEGVAGAYHVLRLREGDNTRLDPADRRRTIAAIREAGLEWHTCCEPIGPEHTNEEIADAILFGNEYGCAQNGAMARVNFPGSPLTKFGEITTPRLAQIVAAVALASEGNPELICVGVHEANVESLMSGANSACCEYGVNPRDTCTNTEEGRGYNVAIVNKMLDEAGWD